MMIMAMLLCLAPVFVCALVGAATIGERICVWFAERAIEREARD